jgi:hypothetical protein
MLPSATDSALLFSDSDVAAKNSYRPSSNRASVAEVMNKASSLFSNRHRDDGDLEIDMAVITPAEASVEASFDGSDESSDDIHRLEPWTKFQIFRKQTPSAAQDGGELGDKLSSSSRIKLPPG